MHRELGFQVFFVGFDGFGADAEAFGDLTVAKGASDGGAVGRGGEKDFMEF